MIKFTAELTVKKIEEKSVKKRDGGMFNFTEVTLEKGGKFPTVIQARAQEDIVGDIKLGMKANFDLGITSFTTQDGRVFNNFQITLVEAKQPKEPLETALKSESIDYSDDIPF